MIETRIDQYHPSCVESSKMVSKIVQRLCKDLSDQHHIDEYPKKSLTTYLNTFCFQIGINPPTQQQTTQIYHYLQDPKKSIITKNKFQGFLRKCLALYIEAKREPIGGIVERLVLALRSEAMRERDGDGGVGVGGVVN